ncbi:MAG TPA: hypothetical protein VH255_02125 [Verrucomicrobiae bacterium]|jgi:hypothetical protein|nr:hypothetical protein [Verrucomicrobiae bacterium]
MKLKILLALGLFASFSFFIVQRSVAQDPDRPAKTEIGTQIEIPDTRDGILEEIHKEHEALAAAVSAKKLEAVHGHAFAIRDLTKALQDKANPDMKKMVENAVKRISQLAEAINKSSAAGDRPKTEANLKQLDAALKTLEEHATM